MTTPTNNVRLSPSGPFIGDPGVRTGPGATGLVFRAHGAGDGTTAMNGVTATALAPMDGLTLAVDMQPGYKYEARLYAEYQGQGMTVTAQAWGLYRTHDKASATWGAWTRLTATPNNHYIHAAPSVAESPTGNFEDCLIDLSVTAPVDAIEFALQSDYDSGQPAYHKGLAYAIVTEYQP